MKQRMVFGALWLLAALIAMVVVNQGLGALGAAARSDRVATVPVPVVDDVPADESALAEAEADDDPITSTSATPADDENPSEPPSSAAATTITSPPTTLAANTTVAPAVTSAPPPPTTSTTTAAPPPTPTIPPSTTIPLDSYHIDGVGTVWVDFSPTSVTFNTAIPIEPYKFGKPKQIDAITVRLEFENDDHEVKITATWLDGPSFTIEEDND